MRRVPADDPFVAVHRAGRRQRWLRRLGSVAGLGAVAAIAWGLPTLFPTPGQAAATIDWDAPVIAQEEVPSGLAPLDGTVADPAASPAASPPEGSMGEAAGAEAADPAVHTLPTSPEPPTASSEQAEKPSAPEPTAEEVHIDIDTTGYQAELGRCRWVRMDLGATAPIVGRHNYCGGDVVLSLRTGDHVQVQGEGLGGTYVVVGSRDAKAGDDARTWTQGMQADVILQTCYYDRHAVRLVGLVSSGQPSSRAG